MSLRRCAASEPVREQRVRREKTGAFYAFLGLHASKNWRIASWGHTSGIPVSDHPLYTFILSHCHARIRQACQQRVGQKGGGFTNASLLKERKKRRALDVIYREPYQTEFMIRKEALWCLRELIATDVRSLISSCWEQSLLRVFLLLNILSIWWTLNVFMQIFANRF